METPCSASEDLQSATGLAIAAIASLIERPGPIPRGEVARILNLLAETAAPELSGQKAVLKSWSKILTTAHIANDR